ncbi:hypothetical protein [Pseudomonas sp. MIL9]|jgi:hypothetical protein|nr:hypothetical protein [Pseudomonas sp. MIL9]
MAAMKKAQSLDWAFDFLAIHLIEITSVQLISSRRSTPAKPIC